MIDEERGMPNESMNQITDAAVGGNLVRPDLNPWLDFGTRALRGWMETNSAMLQSSVGFAEQMTTFSESRLKTDLDLWKSLSGCGNMNEVFDCQKKYAERTTSEYLGAVRELADRVVGVVNAATLALREPATRL